MPHRETPAVAVSNRGNEDSVDWGVSTEKGDRNSAGGMQPKQRHLLLCTGSQDELEAEEEGRC